MRVVRTIEIINTTKKTTIFKDAIEAVTLREKLFGLLMYNKPQTMIFRTRFGIHTFGMRYSIDVLVLDQHKKVVKLKESLKPNQIFFWNPQFSTIIELPIGIIRRANVAVGDVILFKN